MKRFLSVALILIGALLLYWGYDLHQRVDSQLIQGITGETPDQVWQYYVTGAVALVLGGYGLVKFRG
ncbi:DUF3185 family protein [Marinospirillum perlucidum]|uniref:DUF3185 family protein n=1 Tax=Marinospirillum perlucidum TaxID=1982602 RepID=UPI000DF32CAD|nr:DUF3185 family protein [Marinospirillum perlucidum]